MAFVAASVAKTGDMKITTPTATLGIRGTTGLVEVPEGAAANNPNNVAVKLYPDADGRVGRIEVNDRAGARLGFLTQGASGFTIRPGAGGARFAAVPLAISPQAVMLRDQGFVRQLHSTQNVGRQLVFRAARLPPRQSRLRQSEPADPAIPARPAAAKWFARTGQARTTAAAWSVEPSRPAAAERPARQPGQPPLPAVPNRQGSSSPASSIGPDNRNSRARRRAPDSSNRARPINPACRREPDNRHAPVCRHSPDCRRVRDNRRDPICRAARPAATRRTTAADSAGAARRAARHGRDCRTGSACPACSSACPAFRERRPCNVRDCPPRRGGPRPRRNAASRRQRTRNCA